MSLPDRLPHGYSRRELRKVLIRLRMEMYRQEIRHESSELLRPLHRVRNFGQDWQAGFGIKHAPLWGVGLVSLLGFLGGRGARTGREGGLSRVVKLTTTLLPLIKLAVRGARRQP